MKWDEGILICLRVWDILWCVSTKFQRCWCIGSIQRVDYDFLLVLRGGIVTLIGNLNTITENSGVDHLEAKWEFSTKPDLLVEVASFS